MLFGRALRYQRDADTWASHPDSPKEVALALRASMTRVVEARSERCPGASHVRVSGHYPQDHEKPLHLLGTLGK